MARCLLGLGSNLGDRRAMLRRATGGVGRLDGCQLLAQSRWHETTPIGGPAGQGAFLNGALLLDCTIPAEDLARELQTIESQLGRNRSIRWDARAIDIDLLLFANKVIESPNLSIPHPRMSFRKFVLEPAAEIAGFMVDPLTGWTLSRLLSHLQEAPRYVVVASPDPAIATWLTENLSQELGPPDLDTQLAQSAATRRAPKEPTHRIPQRGGAPVVSVFRYDETNASTLSPALVIMVEPSSQEIFWKKMGTKKRKKTESFPPSKSFHEFSHKSLKCKGHGPMAHIRDDNPAIVLQEALAAIRSVWPELPVLSQK